jgi:hypothetical protein
MAIEDDLYSIGNAMDIVTESNDGLVRSFANLSESGKGWTVFSRLVSGSGLWRLQNKVRAISDILFIFYRRQDEGLKNAMEQARNMSKLSQEYSKLGEIISEGKLEETAEFQSYFLAFKSVLDDEQDARKHALSLTEKAYNSTYAKLGNTVKKFGKNLVKNLPDKEILEAQEKVNAAQKKAEGRFGVFAKGIRRRMALKSELGSLQTDPDTDENIERQGEIRRLLKANAKGNKLRFGLMKTQAKKNLKLRKELLKAKFAKRMKELGAFAKIAKSFLLKFIVGFALVGFVLIVLRNFLEKFGPQIFDNLKAVFGFLASVVWPGLKAFLGIIGDGIVNIFGGLKDGNLLQFLGGILQVLFGLLGALITATVGVVIALLGGLGAVIFSFFQSYLDGAQSTGEKIVGFVQGLLQVIVVIGAVIAGIAAFVAGAPVWLAVTIGAAIIGIGTFLVTKLGDALKNILPEWMGGTPRAMGGIVNEDTTLVGEKGPELVSLPRGSRVHTNAQSKRMGGRITNNITVQVQGRIGASDQEIRDIAKKVGEHINREINRHTSSGVRRYG